MFATAKCLKPLALDSTSRQASEQPARMSAAILLVHMLAELRPASPPGQAAHALWGVLCRLALLPCC